MRCYNCQGGGMEYIKDDVGGSGGGWEGRNF